MESQLDEDFTTIHSQDIYDDVNDGSIDDDVVDRYEDAHSTFSSVGSHMDVTYDALVVDILLDHHDGDDDDVHE